MSRANVKQNIDTRRVTQELFTLTYGAFVAQILNDYEHVDEVNKQLDKIGYNMGVRLIDDFLARNPNINRCNDLRETAEILSKQGFKTYLGISPSITNWSPAGDEFSLLPDGNPLTEFVELPEGPGQKLSYNQMICGAIRGALEMDNGNPPLSSQAIVSIHLIDADNLDPRFNSPTSYHLNVSIDTPLGYEVIPSEGRIFAYDQDIGINTTILYSFLTSNVYLSIDKYTGILTLQSNFESTTQFDLLIKAEQEDNIDRSVTTILHVNVYELNLYAPRFLAVPYTIIGYTTNNPQQIPQLTGSVNDMDANPRLTFGYSCNSSQLNLQITKISARQFQLQPTHYQNLPRCQPCSCFLNVSDGRYSDQTTLSLFLYTPVSSLMSSYLFSTDYPSDEQSAGIGQVQIVGDDRCRVQYSLLGQSDSLFSISE